MTEPAIGREAARAVCDTVWPDRAAAEQAASRLAAAGWMVVGRFPSRFGTTDQVIIASVHHPETCSSPGDVMYRDPLLIREPREWRGDPPHGRLMMQTYGPLVPVVHGEPGWLTAKGWRFIVDEPMPVWTTVEVRAAGLAGERAD